MNSLKNKSISGIKWVTVSKVIRQVLQAVTVVIIANLVSPSDFGLMGMALVVIGFFAILRDLGFTAALIQKKDVTNSLLSSVFWFNIAIGILLLLVLYHSATIIADFYEEENLIPILEVLSFGFLFASLSFVHQALIERELLFDKVAKFEIFSSIAASVIGITTAILGYGVWALVFQSLSTSLFTTIILWVINDWRPKFEFQLPEIKKIFNFSVNLSGFNILNFFVRNGDYFLIGKFLGAEQLGYYTLAYQIILYPLQNLSQIINRVMFPAFSKIQNDNEKFRRYYIQVAKYIALLAFPIMISIFVLANETINVFFGEKWISAISILLIFAPLGLLQSVYTNAGVIFQAKGRTDIWLKWGMLTAVLFLTGFYLGLKWGILGVAISYLFVNLITIIPGIKIPFNLIELKLSSYMKSLVTILMINIFLLFVMFATKFILLEFGITYLMVFIATLLIGVLTYISSNFVFNKPMVKEITGIIKAKF